MPNVSLDIANILFSFDEQNESFLMNCWFICIFYYMKPNRAIKPYMQRGNSLVSDSDLSKQNTSLV